MKLNVVCRFLISLTIISCAVGISVLASDLSVRAAGGSESGEALLWERASEKKASPGDASYGRPLTSQEKNTLSTPSEALKADEAAASGGEKEFWEWFKGEENGETFQLTDNIVWKGGIITSIRELSVDMNGYGFIIPPNSYMGVSGPFTFRGSAGMPMFTIERGGGLLLNEDVVLEADNGCGILLEGDQVSGSRGDTFLGVKRVKIRASGSNAVGIKAQGSILLEYADIELEHGACGVEAARDAAGYLSWIRGDGTSILAGGKVVSDTSAFDPLPVKTEIIKRDIYPSGGNIIFTDQSDFKGRLEETQSYILSCPGCSDRMETVEVDWDVSEVDFAVPGTYQATAWPRQWFDEASGLVFPAGTVPVVVTDPNKIYLQNITRRGDRYNAVLYKELPQDQEMRLYYSTDDGEHWEIWPLERRTNDTIFVMKGLPDSGRDYLFQAEAADGAKVRRSNILEVHIGTDGTTSRKGTRDDSRRDAPDEIRETFKNRDTSDGSEKAEDAKCREVKPAVENTVEESTAEVAESVTVPGEGLKAKKKSGQNGGETVKPDGGGEEPLMETAAEDAAEPEAVEVPENVSKTQKQSKRTAAEALMVFLLLLVGGISGLAYYRVQKNG